MNSSLKQIVFQPICKFFFPIFCMNYYLQNNKMTQRFHVYLVLFLIGIQISQSITLISVGPDYRVSYQIQHNELAHIYYDQKIRTQGMNYIWVYANGQKSLLDQHRGAGFLEGYATYKEIFSAYSNLQKYLFSATGTAKKGLQQYLDQQLQFLRKKIDENLRELYWQYVGAYLEQCVYGYRGYLQRIHEESRLDMFIGFSQYYFLTNNGDLEDLIPAFYENYTKPKSGSVYIRNQEDGITITHSTINDYVFMLRVFKTYNFPSRDARIGSEMITFSSRPADLSSKDDYYVLSSGLRVLETSLNNFNADNYKELNPLTVPCWLRSILACNLARTGSEWIDYFSKYNSGTHSNQWVIVDPTQLPSEKNAILFFEQAFSLMKQSDLTSRFIKDGYIASYNTAYNKQIYDKLEQQKYPYSYDQDPRATAFKNYHDKINNVEDMKYWLVTNEQSDPREGIAPRNDSYTQKPGAFGAMDCKIMTPSNFADNFYWAISSPPTSHGRFKPFSWDTVPSVPHSGMPSMWDFPWVQIPIDFEKHASNQPHLSSQ